MFFFKDFSVELTYQRFTVRSDATFLKKKEALKAYRISQHSNKQ